MYYTELCSVTSVSSLLCSSPHIVKAKESDEQKQGEIQHGEASAALLFLSTVNSKAGVCREELCLQWLLESMLFKS